MTGLNRIFLMGYLGNAPRVTMSRKGTPYTTLSICSPKKKADEKPEGEQETKETADWHSVHVWGKQSELCAKFLNKGRVVLVEGYLAQYSVDKEGKKERRTAINAVRVDWLPKAESVQMEQLSLEGTSAEALPQ